METSSHSDFRRLARWIAGAAATLFVAWAIISITRVGTVFWAFSDIATWIATNLNVDDRAATLIAVILTACTIPLLPLLTSFVIWGRNRYELIAAAVAAAAVIFGLLYAFGDDVFFDHRTGEPLRYYSDTPSGIVFSRSPGFDKKFGISRKPVTPQIIESLEKEKAGVRPKRIDLAVVRDLEFFSTVDGKPKIWFYRAPNGALDLFDGPGFHPQRREPLAPISPELVVVVEKLLLNQREIAAARTKIADDQLARRKREQEQKVVEAANAERARHELAQATARREELDKERAKEIAERVVRPNQSLSEGGFTFVLTTIRRSGGNLLVELLATANQDDLGLSVHTTAGPYSSHTSTNLYDRAGNLFNPSRALVGDKAFGGYVVKFDRGVPTRITIVFDKVPQATDVSSLVVSCWATWPTGPRSTSGGNFKLPFKNL